MAAGTGRTYSYDANGNLTSIQENGAVTRAFEWDAEDRLVAINYPGSGNRTEFSYDPMSRRVRATELGSVTSDERLVWDDLAVAEIRSTATGAVTNRFFGMGEQRGALTLYYFRDHLGSVREMTDASGTLRARYDYSTWGERSANRVLSNPLTSSFGYTGHFQHGRSGLVLAPFRAYDASAGRWISRDPLGEEGGVNLHAYVLNEPVGSWDLLGLIEGSPNNLAKRGLISRLARGYDGSELWAYDREKKDL